MIEKISYKKNKHSVLAVEDKCNRCLSKHIVIAENNHYYCEDCYENRIISDHLYLERYERIRKSVGHQLSLSFALSESQIKGSNFINDCYVNKNQGYLHAVCGAGKTEMSLHTIFQALKFGNSIVFVIPRVEIIKQLYQRFMNYFPKSNICPLYQDMPFDESADLYISTPQQLIKFYKEFDLMFIDEVDAFPYYRNKHLHRLVNKSLKDSGVLIYISATLPSDYKQMIDREEMQYCLIPNRFHGKDLVIPSFKKYAYMYSDKLLADILKYTVNQKKLMIYFPSINLMTRYKWFLEKNHIMCEMISSKTKYRNEPLRKFKNNDYHILLTTTLLERGITFSNCDVFVFESDHHVFNKDTLTQIAGRVGRDQFFTSGNLIFYSRFITKDMIKARDEMTRMNRMKKNDMQVMS
ncbi:DEAD/DEAH box helicase family protein [Mycoplasmatota bacterium]|nr:DEAD/DEAH box helicase family protein [Mycoplasmatota bacterium]